jgi:hypothetical protein
MFLGVVSTVTQILALPKFPRPTRNQAIPDMSDGVSDSKKSPSSVEFRVQRAFVGDKTPTTTKRPDCNALVVLATTIIRALTRSSLLVGEQEIFHRGESMNTERACPATQRVLKK